MERRRGEGGEWPVIVQERLRGAGGAYEYLKKQSASRMTHTTGRDGGGLLRPLAQLDARGPRGTTAGTAKGHVAVLPPPPAPKTAVLGCYIQLRGPLFTFPPPAYPA